MRQSLSIIALGAVSIYMGCRDMRPKAQDWVISAPEVSALGISCSLALALESPAAREAITKYPQFDQALELFLDKAKIDPTSETGRVSVYFMNRPGAKTVPASTDDLAGLAQTVFFQIAGFRDPKAIERMVIETFPPAGSLNMRGREYPLFVVFDVNNFHLRVFSDNEGRLWIGEMAVLEELAKRRGFGDNSPVSRASEWVSRAGAIQGFIQPELLPSDMMQELAKVVPPGIKGVAWSVSPPADGGQTVELDLVVTGAEDAIAQLKPWMQRLIAMASTLGGEGSRPPDTVQENNRMGIRCQFNKDQLADALKLVDLNNVIVLPKDAKLSAPAKTKK
jgi:hypothetical protein